ncbi:MAG: YceI family protein [Candidatus Schekmanbacteria bacterium]|nr:YceI family protein [Candidatus Schekmanbacteria bacterium]
MRVFATTLLLISTALFASAPGAAATTWTLKQSKIAYHVDHLLHKSEGVSVAAKGKGSCGVGPGCAFRIAVPVKTFESGDSNRDLHMQEITRAASFPLIDVKARFASAPEEGPLTVSLEIAFAGRSRTYGAVALAVVSRTPDAVTVTGEIPLKLSDFEVERPSLLGVAVKDEVALTIEAVWEETSSN